MKLYNGGHFQSYQLSISLFCRLIPSSANLSYEDPVAAPPPPGYESGFPITEDPGKGSSEKCSTTEVESRL